MRALRGLDRLWYAIVSIGTLLLGWQLTSTYLVNPYLVPPPTVVFATAWKLLLNGELLVHIAASLKRIIAGFVTGSMVGIVLGALIGRIDVVRHLLDPIIEFARPISAVAMVPLSIIWFGIEEPSRYFIIFYTAVFTVLINTAAGVAQTPVIRIRAARCLGASELDIFLRVVVPSALPYILTGMRVALGLAFMAIVAAEMIAASTGIGYLIMEARMLVQTERTFVGLITLGIIGAILDRIFRNVINRTMARYMQYLYQQ